MAVICKLCTKQANLSKLNLRIVFSLIISRYQCDEPIFEPPNSTSVCIRYPLLGCRWPTPWSLRSTEQHVANEDAIQVLHLGRKQILRVIL